MTKMRDKGLAVALHFYDAVAEGDDKLFYRKAGGNFTQVTLIQINDELLAIMVLFMGIRIMQHIYCS